ncbi:MAG: FRG domain-containing protein [Rikenellaceae bacterium]
MNKQFNLYPPQRHFGNIAELKEELAKYENTREFEHEKQEVYNHDCREFECIRLNNGQIVHLPTNANFTLYRGQNEKHDTCVPSLYRSEISEDEIFVKNLQITEFELMLRQHSVVKCYFEYNNLRVDYRGLAQHYGLDTDLLDLSSNIDVALFFATCVYDKATDLYYAQHDDKCYTGVIYVYPIMQDIFANYQNSSVFENKLQVIGMQAFKRPMLQHGFSYQLNRGESLRAIAYTFDYTRDDSLRYFNKFDEGNALWIKDDLSKRTKLLLSSKIFSSDAFSLSLERYSQKYKKSDYYHDVLNKSGYSIRNKNELPWTFTLAEQQDILDEWNDKDKEEFESKACRRKTFEEGVGWKQETDVEKYALMLMHRIPMSFDNVKD